MIGKPWPFPYSIWLRSERPDCSQQLGRSLFYQIIDVIDSGLFRVTVIMDCFQSSQSLNANADVVLIDKPARS
jgi:hypothetical protein